jgi:hypothetical protein
MIEDKVAKYSSNSNSTVKSKNNKRKAEEMTKWEQWEENEKQCLARDYQDTLNCRFVCYMSI